MEKFTRFSSRLVPLPVDNIDTDQIIPARFLKTITKTGLDKNLFCDWRYDAEGNPKPDFILNQPRAQGAAILLAGDNFGCGSSREHAPWALTQFGFRAIVSTSFADIFKGNSAKNSLLTIEVPADVHAELLKAVEADENYEVTVDLAAQKLILADGRDDRVPDRPVRQAVHAQRRRRARLDPAAGRGHQGLRGVAPGADQYTGVGTVGQAKPPASTPTAGTTASAPSLGGLAPRQSLAPRDKSDPHIVLPRVRTARPMKVSRLLLLPLILWCAATAVAAELTSETKTLVELLGLRPGMTVAEIGAGDGTMTVDVARFIGAEGRVYSTEVERRKVDDIERRVTRSGLKNIVPLLGTAGDSGLPAGCCDAIYMRRVYHHFTAPDAMNASLYQALRPGGRMAVIDFTPRGYGQVAGAPKNRGGHGIRPDLLIEELTAAGFVVERQIDSLWRNEYCVVVRKPE